MQLTDKQIEIALEEVSRITESKREQLSDDWHRQVSALSPVGERFGSALNNAQNRKEFLLELTRAVDGKNLAAFKLWTTSLWRAALDKYTKERKGLTDMLHAKVSAVEQYAAELKLRLCAGTWEDAAAELNEFRSKKF